MRMELNGKKEGLYELIEVSEEFGPEQILIDDHKIKTYAFTQNDYHPWYFTTSPFGRRLAHSSLLANDLLSLFLTKYDPNTIIGLHAEEEMYFHSPVFADEMVTLHGVYTDKFIKRDKGYVVMEAEARGEDGRLLMKHRGTEIMRVHAGSVVAKKTAADIIRKVTGEYDRSLPEAATASREMPVGTPIKHLVKVTSPEQSAVYSWVGRYVKNIHNNMEQALVAGMPRPVVQGQQQFGYVTEMLTNFFGASWFTGGWLKVKFIQPVLVGETVTARGKVVGAAEENGQIKLELEVWVENESGDLTTVGWASAFVQETAPSAIGSLLVEQRSRDA